MYDTVSAIVSLLVSVGVIVLIVFIINSIRNQKRIRCWNCGYRGTRSEFVYDRCTNCGSLEMD